MNDVHPRTDVVAPPSHDAVPVAETWDLTPLYRDDAAWEQAKAALARRLPGVAALAADFGRSPRATLAALDAVDAVERELVRLRTYADLRSDQDTRDAAAQALRRELDVVAADVAAATAWLRPAVLALGRATIDAYLAQEPGLAVHRQPLDDILRRAPHTLTPAAEQVLAAADLVGDVAENIYTVLSEADLRYPTIELTTGEAVELTEAAYVKYRESPARRDRLAVYEAFWRTFEGYARTFAATLDAAVKRDLFRARARGYRRSIESALDQDNVPVAVYEQLIAAVRGHLPTLHRYLALRARLLGLDDLAYYDLHAPLVPASSREYAYPDAAQLVRRALAPLGPEYGRTLATALSGRWIDVRPTRGKASGAYSAGDAYDVHPYILLNYGGTYEDVSTLAHELGHALHSHLSNTGQPHPTAGYPIFLAEVASATNEALLFHHMLAREADPAARLSLIGSYLDGMRATIFRQAMFAEFELAIHAAVEAGEALTDASLSRAYGDLLREYHGHDRGLCRIDPLYHCEWAYVSHFYANFYVFQYVTGMVAGTALARRLLAGGPRELADYLSLLRGGSSRYPLDALARAGVDLSTPAPLAATMRAMNELMDELEARAPDLRT